MIKEVKFKLNQITKMISFLSAEAFFFARRSRYHVLVDLFEPIEFRELLVIYVDKERWRYQARNSWNLHVLWYPILLRMVFRFIKIWGRVCISGVISLLR